MMYRDRCPLSSVARRAATTVGVVLLLAACGLPHNSTTRTIATDDVPYRLLDPAPTSSPSPSSTHDIKTTPQVYFVNQDNELEPHVQPLKVAAVDEVVEALLAALAAGPAPADRKRGLATALGPGAALKLIEVRRGTARVAITPGGRPPDAERLPLAVGQVVLTVTSAEGVDRVVFVHDGDPVAVPLPGGEQTSEPVTAQNYASLLSETAVREGERDSENSRP